MNVHITIIITIIIITHQASADVGRRAKVCP